MTFKLRSGNSPKFKHMGSSPLKDNHDDGLGNPADEINKRTTRTKVDKLQDELDYNKKKAAEEKGVSIKWGAAWSEGDIRSYKGKAEDAMNAYIDLRRSQGRRPFMDGPHFELMR